MTQTGQFIAPQMPTISKNALELRRVADAFSQRSANSLFSSNIQAIHTDGYFAEEIPMKYLV